MYRDQTKVIQIGNQKIGGGNPILIQSMTNTKTEDVQATVAQILRLEAAGCEDAAYPWSDSPVETIEAMIEAVQLPEREVYPGADVVELVNRKGDITTAYKLLDGRYMDRIDRIFVFDGKDTWTDEDGVEWNEVVK